MLKISPRKQPLQPRAKATCAAILEAATQLLQEVGQAGLNTNAIAERAGVSIGTLYQYYPSKEAILAECIRAMRSEMLEDLVRAASECDGATRAEAVHRMIRASLEHHRRAPALAEALETIESNLPLDAEIAALKARIADVATEVLARHGPVPPKAVQDIAAISSGMAHAAVTVGETDFEDLAQRITAAVLGYLSAST